MHSVADAAHLRSQVLKVYNGAIDQSIVAKFGTILQGLARLLPLLGGQGQALPCWVVLLRYRMVLFL